MKKVSDMRMVMHRVSFSPESGGVRNPQITCKLLLGKTVFAGFPHHARNEDTRSNQVVEVVKSPSPQMDLIKIKCQQDKLPYIKCDVDIGLWPGAVDLGSPDPLSADQEPLGVLAVVAHVRLPGVRVLANHRQIDQGLVVSPRAKLELTMLLIEGKPGHVDAAGGGEDARWYLLHGAVAVDHERAAGMVRIMVT